MEGHLATYKVPVLGHTLQKVLSLLRILLLYRSICATQAQLPKAKICICE